MNKKLSKLSFKDKGISVGFGSIKHSIWLRRDKLALHHHLFTLEEILEKTMTGGGQHLDLAEGVSSLLPGNSVTILVTTTKTVSFY